MHYQVALVARCGNPVIIVIGSALNDFCIKDFVMRRHKSVSLQVPNKEISLSLGDFWQMGTAWNSFGFTGDPLRWRAFRLLLSHSGFLFGGVRSSALRCRWPGEVPVGGPSFQQYGTVLTSR